MALNSTVKKRTNLLSIVDRLVKKNETKNDAIVSKKQEEEPLSSPRPAVSIRPYLLPPTPSSGPASPAISDQESISEEEQSSDKGDVTQDEKEEIKKDAVPKVPLRCDVCGLRAFKSYRFVNRTSAPVHLKSFVTPDNDRIRVCKRCFSSRERCRQNLALILLRSKTSQMVHLRTPLGVTYNRATKGIEYIARDLRKGLKRPYEDLLCDETMADEDEMENDSEKFLLNSDETKSKEAQSPKRFGTENENVKQDKVPVSPIKNIGIVTVVRHRSGKYSSTPNCFTLYGEDSNLKDNENVTEKAEKQKENGLAIDVTENLRKLVEHSISLPPTVNKTTTSEINTINNKLTFLDHAYALPPPKGKTPSSPRAVTKPVKPSVPKEAKVPNNTKQDPQKKTVTTDGQTTTSERTCGIVCFQCDKLVTKSYSCYKKENAPEKIKHLFTSGVKIVKVCRRCMPYKKPKDGSEDGAGTGKGKVKVLKGKLAKLHSAKLIKNAKSGGKANAVKTSDKTKVTSVDKNSVKLLTKDEKKRKDSAKDDKSKVLPASKKLCSLAVQTKKIPVSKGTVTKELKVLNVKLVQALPKGIHPPVKEESKGEAGKSNNPKGANAGSKTLLTLSKSGTQTQKNDTSVTEKAKNSTVEKENDTVSKQKSVKVDSGTQSMKSMIGVNRVKTKATDSSLNESVEEDEVVLLSVDDNVVDKKPTVKEADVEDVSKKQENVAEKTPVESKPSEEVSATEAETVTTSDVEASVKEKNDEEINIKLTDKDKTSDKLEENQVESKELEVESKHAEGPKEGTKQDKEETAVSINIAENIMTRGRRSASRSPVITRETKSTEVPSPRKCRSLNTPERKREDKQIMPTVMTRKRLASFSESEADKKVDDTPGGKKRALAAALLEKMSRKAADLASSTASAATNKVKVEHPYAKEEKEPGKEVKGHCMTRRNQMPVKCAGCNEKVVKSYRCVTRGDAPVHIKPLFAQQSGEMLRICRKCVKKKEVGNAKN
ncbi:uncharacterized protein LOC144646311 [Oculina patagonica]